MRNKLKEEIEDLKEEVNSKVSKGNFLDDEVQAVSKKLDEKIFEFMKQKK